MCLCFGELNSLSSRVKCVASWTETTLNQSHSGRVFVTVFYWLHIQVVFECECEGTIPPSALWDNNCDNTWKSNEPRTARRSILGEFYGGLAGKVRWTVTTSKDCRTQRHVTSFNTTIHLTAVCPVLESALLCSVKNTFQTCAAYRFRQMLRLTFLHTHTHNSNLRPSQFTHSLMLMTEKQLLYVRASEALIPLSSYLHILS